MAALMRHCRVLPRLLHRLELRAFSVSPQQQIFEFWDKKKGIPVDTLVLLQQDYDLSLTGINRKLREAQWRLLKESQKFLPERHKTLGPDLATSHFIVKRGGAVKFVGRDTWFKMDENEKYYLPNRKIDGMLLEAIDASQTSLMHIAFDNFVDLKALRFLRLSDCPFIDDWCLIRLQQLKDSLEFLDISGCSRVTDHGLATLHHLEKLTALKMSNLPNVQNPQLMALLLEEATGCQVYGVDFNTDPDKDSKTNEKT